MFPLEMKLKKKKKQKVFKVLLISEIKIKKRTDEIRSQQKQ
jgi:hypothetical protein